jgi:hypothetical protein
VEVLQKLKDVSKLQVQLQEKELMITAAVKNQAKNDMLIVEKNKIIFALKEKIKIAKE